MAPGREPGAGSRGPGPPAAAAGRRAPAAAGTGSASTQAAAPCAAGGRRDPGLGTWGATVTPGPSRQLQAMRGGGGGVNRGPERGSSCRPRRCIPSHPAPPKHTPHLPPLQHSCTHMDSPIVNPPRTDEDLGWGHPAGPKAAPPESHLSPLHSQHHPKAPTSTKRGCPAVTPPTPTSLTQRVGGAVGGGLGGQDDELGGGLLGEGEDGLHGAGHGGGEGGWQVLVQRGVANAWGGGRGAKGGCQQWGEGGSPMLPRPPCGTDRRSAPPSRWRGCGCGAASACAPGVRGQPGPPRAALLAARSPPPSSGGG